MRGWHARCGRGPAVHCGTGYLKHHWVTGGCSTGLQAAEQTGQWETSCIQNEPNSQTFTALDENSTSYTATIAIKYRKTELIFSTVISERRSAELSRVRRQLRACLATNRPAVGGHNLKIFVFDICFSFYGFFLWIFFYWQFSEHLKKTQTFSQFFCLNLTKDAV